MTANWQRIGGVEVCEGADGTVGIKDKDGDVFTFMAGKYMACKKTDAFERAHCQPRHIIERCADGAVFVKSTEQVDGMPKRGAMVVAGEDVWWCYCVEKHGFYAMKEEAIAAAVAYVSAR